jgi:hypothetical protein
MIKSKENTIAEKFGLVINDDFEDEPDFLIEETEEQLQRTIDWRLQRNGCWSASMSKKLMTCNSKGGKMSWDNPQKTLEFSSGILKVIYSIAMSRKRGYYIETDIGLSAKYGTSVEPLIYEIARKHFSESKLNIKKVGFVRIPEIPTAGASSDCLLENVYGEIIHNGEIKACTNWETHYERTFDLLDESGTDFWQVQFQMMAHKAISTIYIVSEPPSDIKKYIFSSDIMELLPDFEKECKISYQEVKASEIHQKALFTRIEIVEKVANEWLENGGDLKDIFYKEVDLRKSKMKEGVIYCSKPNKDFVYANDPLKTENEDYFPDFTNSELSPDSKKVDEVVEKAQNEINLENLPEDLPF